MSHFAENTIMTVESDRKSKLIPFEMGMLFIENVRQVFKYGLNNESKE